MFKKSKTHFLSSLTYANKYIIRINCKMFTLMPAVLGVCAPHDYVIRFGHALATYESQPVFNLNTGELIVFD
jgi:hypothetical protein